MADDSNWQGETTGESWAELRSRREAALRELARQAPAPEVRSSQSEVPRPPTLAPRHKSATRRRAIAIAALAALVVLVSVGAVAVHNRLPSIPPRPTLAIKPITIVSDANGLGCVLGAAWSPDGARIAVLGYENGGASANPCAGFTQQPGASVQYVYWAGMVNVYDTASGKPLRSIHLDPPIDSTLHLRPPANLTPLSHAQGGSGDVGAVVSYDRLIWSADSQALAVTFEVPRVTNIKIDQSGSTSYETVGDAEGVERVGVADGFATVLAQRIPSSQSVLPGAWDFTTGRLVPYPATQPGLGYPPPALSYAWNADGTLATAQVLTPDAPPASFPVEPVGNTYGLHFSIWQPATLAPITTHGVGGVTTRIPGAFGFTTTITAWSPDSRYLTSFPIYGAIETSAAAQSFALPSASPQGTMLLPVRDAGLRAALNAAEKRTGFGNDASAENIEVAWRPDGRDLAVLAARVVAPPINGTPQLAYDVTLYDCASGRALGTFTVAQPGIAIPITGITPDGGSFSPALAWSSDGTRLLVSGPAVDTMTLWDVGAAMG